MRTMHKTNAPPTRRGQLPRPSLRSPTERNELAEANLIVVRVTVRQMTRRGGRIRHVEPADLYQEGYLGLLRAAELYDPQLGFRFSTYARGWVRQKISMLLQRGGVVALPRQTLAENVPAVRSIDALREQTGFDTAAPEEESAEDWEAVETVSKAIRAAMSRLTGIHREVLTARFLHGETLKAIGDRLEMKAETIRTRQIQALQLLRQDPAIKQVRARLAHLQQLQAGQTTPAP